MKKLAVISTIICLSIAILTPLHAARAGGGGGGGGGRGGGGGGGGARMGGGGSINRTPSISRAASNRPAQTSNRSEINNRLRQSPRNMQDFTKNSNPSNNQRLNDILKNRTTSNTNRAGIGDSARNDIAQQYPGHGQWFNNDFNHNHNFSAGYDIGNGNAWRAASWGALRNWNNWGWSEPYYYDYGDLDDDNFVYADQAQDIAAAPAPAPAESNPATDWMSLGVFAVTNAAQTGATPNVYMQLALNKNGNIDGTVYNATSNQTYTLEGLVDKDSQRAAWMMSNAQNAPIIETGIYNLTQDQAPARVTYADGQTKNILLVRVKQ